MKVYSAEIQGDNTSDTIANLLARQNNTPPRTWTAYYVVFAETTAGQTSSRIGPANVSANLGIPLAVANDYFTLPPVPSSSARPWMWDLTTIYAWVAQGDTLSITAWCDN